jgi:regulatory protein YycH of two-component signal transduction system YycFG
MASSMSNHYIQQTVSTDSFTTTLFEDLSRRHLGRHFGDSWTDGSRRILQAA